jgi:pimeloyl-ACP methyl ester carboxylesterase
MHEEALRVLPRLVDELVGRPPVIVGHSDGASIALIYAGSGHPVEALVLIAPHVFVEPLTMQSISAIRDSFEESELPEKMARYHTDPSATFYGWADIWLSPAFANWDITEYLPGVSCPTLLVQGDQDEYGTMGQVEAIESSLAGETQRLIVPGAGHSPHLSHPHPVVEATVGFIEAST